MEEFRIDPTIAYDVVELPSKGITYPNKKKSVRVAYLTAADENILSSANLVASGDVLDELLKRKILDRDIEIEDYMSEDKEAILIFLRNTAFGSEYTIPMTDPKTKETFKTVIDLSTLKVKDFTLVEDVNGEYPFFLPASKLNITFKFLTQKQEKELAKMPQEWKGGGTPPIITKRLEMHIQSLNGNKNQMEIFNFINNKMPITDSQALRKYISQHKPGLDLNQSIETPSKEIIQVQVGFGAEFFRPFYGI